MIAFLEGTIELVGEKFLIVNVGGIGYRVFTHYAILQRALDKGAFIKLWIHQRVREDTNDLYGFLHYAELDLFETLLSVSGIGPKGALGVLGMGSIDSLKRAIAAGDASYLTRVSGIGRKTAEKIVLELKEKMAGRGVTVDAPELQGEADALDALLALGYSQREAREALASVSREITEPEKIIKEVLKKLGKK